MRLAPVENPDSPEIQAAYKASQALYGKVLGPLKTVMARVPAAHPVTSEVVNYLNVGCSLPPRLKFFIQILVAQLNHCAFCQDIGASHALAHKVSPQELGALARYQESPLFSDAEKAALAYVSEATEARIVADQTFARLQANYSDREIAEITLILAIEHYFNMINIPLQIEADGLCSIALSAV